MADTKATINISITGSDIVEVQAMVLALADRLGDESIGSVNMDVETPAATVTLTSNIELTTDPEPEQKPKDKPAVSDMTPAEAKETGIKAVQTYFATHPESLSEITAIQKKYNVKMFTDIKETNAIDFLADVMLLTAGAPSA